jgi:hypothetical protein
MFKRSSLVFLIVGVFLSTTGSTAGASSVGAYLAQGQIHTAFRTLSGSGTVALIAGSPGAGPVGSFGMFSRGQTETGRCNTPGLFVASVWFTVITQTASGPETHRYLSVAFCISRTLEIYGVERGGPSVASAYFALVKKSGDSHYLVRGVIVQSTDILGNTAQSFVRQFGVNPAEGAAERRALALAMLRPTPHPGRVLI